MDNIGNSRSSGAYAPTPNSACAPAEAQARSPSKRGRLEGRVDSTPIEDRSPSKRASRETAEKTKSAVAPTLEEMMNMTRKGRKNRKGKKGKGAKQSKALSSKSHVKSKRKKTKAPAPTPSPKDPMFEGSAPIPSPKDPMFEGSVPAPTPETFVDDVDSDDDGCRTPILQTFKSAPNNQAFLSFHQDDEENSSEEQSPQAEAAAARPVPVVPVAAAVPFVPRTPPNQGIRALAAPPRIHRHGFGQAQLPGAGGAVIPLILPAPESPTTITLDPSRINWFN